MIIIRETHKNLTSEYDHTGTFPDFSVCISYILLVSMEEAKVSERFRNRFQVSSSVAINRKEIWDVWKSLRLWEDVDV